MTQVRGLAGDRACRELERAAARGDKVAAAALEHRQARACSPEFRRRQRQKQRLSERARGAAERIRQLVDAVQHRARVRTVDADYVIGTVAEVARGGGDWTAPRSGQYPTCGYWTTGRESVPNSYKYPAWYTGVDIIRWGNRVVVSVERESCSRSTPLGLSRIGSHWRDDTIREHLEANVYAALDHEMEIPLRVARLLDSEELDSEELDSEELAD